MTKPTQPQIPLAAAAEVGRTGQEASDNATSSLDWTVAAEAGEQAPLARNKQKMIWQERDELERATIERCAQVAENARPCGTVRLMRESIAAAIRALKDA